jgi:hypothetical protein
MRTSPGVVVEWKSLLDAVVNIILFIKKAFFMAFHPQPEYDSNKPGIDVALSLIGIISSVLAHLYEQNNYRLLFICW